MSSSRPTARVDGITAQSYGDESLLHDERRGEFHTLNAAATAVWRACDGSRTAVSISRETGLDPAIVGLALDELSDRDLLETPAARSGLTRRDVVRRLAVAGAVTLPVIGSITQGASASPVTCAGNGAPCFVAPECCPGSVSACNAGFCLVIP